MHTHGPFDVISGGISAQFYYIDVYGHDFNPHMKEDIPFYIIQWVPKGFFTTSATRNNKIRPSYRLLADYELFIEEIETQIKESQDKKEEEKGKSQVVHAKKPTPPAASQS